MTESSEFREAFQAFRTLPYPDRPRTEELRDWDSRLLELDSHIAGYATRVNGGDLDAAEVPEIESLVLEAESLQRDLGEIRPGPREPGDADLLNQYRAYVVALVRVVRGMASLARGAGRKGNSPAS